MTPEAKLQASVETLYGVFSVYARPKCLPGAMGDIDIANDAFGLLSKPIRDLTAKGLSYYSHCAITSIGSVDEFKFYLPRILELATLDSAPVLDTAIIFSKLSYGKWEEWPITEQQCLLAYFATLWETTLLTSPALSDAGSCLDGIAQAMSDLTPYLNTWLDLCDQHATAVEHLIEFCVPDIGDSDDTETITFSSWLTYLPDREAQIRAWLFSPSVKATMLRGCKALDENTDSWSRADWVLETYLNDYARYNESGKP